MIKTDERLKKRVQESITNLVNSSIIPADEQLLNIDVIYNSILNEICAVVPIDSPRQVISYYKMSYDSENKSLIEKDKDIFTTTIMNGVGAVPFNSDGYSSEDVKCTIILNSENKFLPSYKKIIPGTIEIYNKTSDLQAKDSDLDGNIITNNNVVVGSVDYSSGLFSFNNSDYDGYILNYKFDIYDLMTDRNFVKLTKQFIEVFADMYQLDIDSAMCLNDIKNLNFKDNIKNILPQVLSQQIDQEVFNKIFNQAEQQIVGSWDATATWQGTSRVPVTHLYEDLGTYLNLKMGEYANKHGVIPNVIVVDSLGYGILSVNKKFIPVVEFEEEYNKDSHLTIPQVVGYYNNAKVILVNTLQNYNVNVVLAFRGNSDAQSVGVFAPFIPVQLRTVTGMEGAGMINTTNAYSIAGFAITNPDLIEGIKITK